MSTTPIIELTEFRVAADRTDELLAARSALMPVLADRTSGMIDQKLLQGEEPGEWIDMITWRSADEAEEAMTIAMELPQAGAYFALIQGEPVMRHLPVAQQPA